MSKQKDEPPSAKGERQFYEDAENAYFNFKNGEEMIDFEKARKITVTHWQEWTERGAGLLGRDKKHKESEVVTLCDSINNSFARYQEVRGSYYWHDAASTWLLAYNTAKSYGCVIPGNTLQKKLDEKDATIKELTERMKRMFDECPRCHYKNMDFFEGQVEDAPNG